LTLTINKSIAATHLKKNGVPSGEPEANIPYGAIIEYIGSDRGNVRFTSRGELYRSPADILASALDGGKIPREPHGPASKAVQEPAQPATQAPAHKLKFESLHAGPYSAARAKVPGGWLVALGSGVTFYPDPEHSWNGESIA
jgi:hypothetical protein